MENLLTDSFHNHLQQFLYSNTIKAFIHKSHDIIIVQILFIMYISHYWSVTGMVSQNVGLKVLRNP